MPTSNNSYQINVAKNVITQADYKYFKSDLHTALKQMYLVVFNHRLN